MENTELQEEKVISIEEFIKLDFRQVTLVDLREPDEVLVKGIPGAINVPLQKLGTGLGKIPKDKTVYVFCRTGDFSKEITEELNDRGYDAYNVEGGFEAYEKYLQEHPVAIDAKGLKCPGPIVKVADTIRALPEGSIVQAEATEDAFASDIRVWCDRTGNKLLSLDIKPDVIVAKIEKHTITNTEAGQKYDSLPHGKTFVVFSGDLDKTIAAFIMANGAAAMGREVTVFFTFWGLNILRRPKKVRVQKNVVEKMFGFMMPQGTLQLGLSRMNMFGMGSKMIRWIMKKHNILSLEELMQEAIDHGVHLVACQMSMEIMGIRKEELIDGVELGGVSTFLGSGEQSDMSLFI
jgi:peroxiredoxin family protein/rhodanese-related sulfurtransferase/TusA-related sulfurtransferase